MKYCNENCYNVYKNRKRKLKLSSRTFQKVLKRAFPNWACPFCSWGKTFVTHHIEHRSNGGNEDTNNLIMLCPNHHSEAHLENDNPGKTINDKDLKKNSIGKHYTGKELMEKFYYGNEMVKFEK